MIYFNSDRSTRRAPGQVIIHTKSCNAVRAFHEAAIRAGGFSHRLALESDPDARHCYSAAVFDLDGNSIEVVFQRPSRRASRTVATISDSKDDDVLRWQRDVSESLSSRDASPQQDAFGEDVLPAPAPLDSASPTVSTKAMFGTILGAAGGAAVAYAMMRAEVPDPSYSSSPVVHQRPITMVDNDIPTSHTRSVAPPPSHHSTIRPVPAAPAAMPGDLHHSPVSATRLSSLISTALPALEYLDARAHASLTSPRTAPTSSHYDRALLGPPPSLHGSSRGSSSRQRPSSSRAPPASGHDSRSAPSGLPPPPQRRSRGSSIADGGLAAAPTVLPSDSISNDGSRAHRSARSQRVLVAPVATSSSASASTSRRKGGGSDTFERSQRQDSLPDESTPRTVVALRGREGPRHGAPASASPLRVMVLRRS